MKDKKLLCKHSTVLLIDDNELDNFINQKVIESANFAQHAYINTSGQSALEFLKNISVAENVTHCKLFPEVIFIDINMPLMDGIQFLRNLIKADRNVIKQSKLAVLTTSVNPADRDRVKQISDQIVFLNKPLTENSLNQV